MTYVVIGSSGFIGAQLANSLNAFRVDREVVDLFDASAVDTLSPLVEGKRCFFCASTPIRNGNIDLAANFSLLEPFLKVAHLCKHVTYLSSDSVYPFDRLVTEDTPVVRQSNYAESHLSREGALANVIGDKLLIARLSQVYGAQDTHNAYGPCRMVRQAMSGGPIVLKGNGEERRDHLYIDDLIRLLAYLSEVEQTGIVNVATGQSVTFQRVAQAVCDLIPSKIETEPRTVGVTHRDFDVSKLTSICRWYNPTPLALEQMIEEINGRKAVQ